MNQKHEKERHSMVLATCSSIRLPKLTDKLFEHRVGTRTSFRYNLEHGSQIRLEPTLHHWLDEGGRRSYNVSHLCGVPHDGGGKQGRVLEEGILNSM